MTMPLPSLYFDFANSKVLDPRLTFTRASTDWGFDSSGILRRVPLNTPVFDYDLSSGQSLGIRLNPEATNSLLHNRDLSQAAWVKTNITAARDQVGLDGASNTASRLTATASNGTVLQTVTLASAERVTGCYVRRLVGVGNIDMTIDGGSTWVPITVGSAWALVSIPAQTITNPSVGFRIATSADAIAVDFVQLESGAAITSPIETGAAAVTRSVGNLTISVGGWYNPVKSSMFVESATSDLGVTGVTTYLATDTNNRMQLQHSSAGSVASQGFQSGSTQWSITPSAPGVVREFRRMAARFVANDIAFASEGTIRGTDSAAVIPVATALRIGGNTVSTAWLKGWVKRVMYFPHGLTNTQLQAITA